MYTLTVLLEEDEPIISMDIRQILENQGHLVIQASALNELLATCAKSPPSLAILNFRRKEDSNGLDIAQYLKERFSIPVLFVTGAMPHEIESAKNLDEGQQILYKPFTASQLRRSVNSVGLLRNG